MSSAVMARGRLPSAWQGMPEGDRGDRPVTAGLAWPPACMSWMAARQPCARTSAKSRESPGRCAASYRHSVRSLPRPSGETAVPAMMTIPGPPRATLS